MTSTFPDYAGEPASPLAAHPPASADLPSLARVIGQNVAGPTSADVDTEGRFPSETIDALRSERMLSVLVPTELGGAGARITDVALATEVLGEYCASAAMVYAMHQIQVASLARHGRSSWAQDYLRVVAERELLLASATTEKGIGGDVRSSSCAVEQTDDRFHLVKDCPVISYGRFADGILVTARRSPDSPPNDQVLVTVPTESAKLDQQTTWNALGFRGTCSDGFILTADGGVDQILSDPYDVVSAWTMLPTSHVLWASVWLGLATSAVDTARVYVRKDARKNPGTTSPVALHLAGLVGVLDQFRSLVHGAAADYEAAIDDPARLTSMGFALQMNSLKVSASTLVVEVVSRALTICGIAGYLEDSPLSLGRRLRDAHGAALMVNNDRILGANAQMLLVHKGEKMSATVGTEKYVAFQDELVDAGVLIRSTVKGLYGKARPFVEVFDGLDRMVTMAGANDGVELFRFPPMLPRDHFVRTDYLRSFPDLIGSIHSFCGGDAEHADFLRRVDGGEDWSESLDPTELVLVPAACYPIYPMITGQLPEGGRSFDVLGSCFRHEGSDDPARMMVFHQHEYVHVGTPDSAMDFRDKWLERAQEMMTGLGLDVRAEVANDPFFGRAGRMLASSQRQAELKYEVVATVADEDRPTAIVSCNCHQDHLTVPFEITTADGERAHSACVGFGMERIVLALFSAHGTNTASWPDEVRRRLWT